MTNAYEVVKMFERRVAAHFDVDHGIAVDCCTNAIFLSLQYRLHSGWTADGSACIPRHTYVSVPFAIRNCGLRVEWRDQEWKYFYSITPWRVIDAAKYWRHRDRTGRSADLSIPLEAGDHLWCLSFHYAKPIPIGRGGMILTNDGEAAQWLRRARYDGREGKPYREEQIKMQGWHMYMTPEQAARGLALMDTYPNGIGVREEDYPDVSKFEAFNEKPVC